MPFTLSSFFALQIEDRTEDNWLGELTGEQFNNIGMNRILSSIRKAKNEDKVQGIYLDTGILETDYATLQEIRNALADFKKRAVYKRQLFFSQMSKSQLRNLTMPP